MLNPAQARAVVEAGIKAGLARPPDPLAQALKKAEQERLAKEHRREAMARAQVKRLESKARAKPRGKKGRLESSKYYRSVQHHDTA